MDVVAAEGLDPPPFATRDAAGLQDLVLALRVRDDRRRVDPLLHDALHPVVERGHHPVAAGVDLLALGIPAQDLAQLGADLPHELRRAPLRGRLRPQDHRLLLGGLVVRVRVLAGRQHRLGLHLFQDEVAADHDLAVHRHHQPHLLGTLGVLVGLLDGVLDEVEPGGRLRDPGEERRLGQGDVLEVLAPVAPDRRRDAVAAVPVEVLVEVLLHDRLLAILAGIGLGQADRLDDLLGLALVDAAREGARREQAHAHQLLGDRGAAAVPAVRSCRSRPR